MNRYLLAILIAVAIAFIFGLINSASIWANAVPWGVVGLLVSAWLGVKKWVAIRLGATFGFTVSYAYLWFDNRGIRSFTQVLILIPFDMLPSLFGLICGVGLGFLGWQLRRLFIGKGRIQ